MWKLISSIAIISCFLMSCYGNRFGKKTIAYPDKIERGNYIIYKDAKELPNWSNYYELMKSYMKSNGSNFGPSLYRHGVGPWSSDGKGIYLDIVPNNKYVLFFGHRQDKHEEMSWSCISVKNGTFSETTELLISIDDIKKMFPGGIYIVFGFENKELILKTYYFL
jgi:hypothetical protein